MVRLGLTTAAILTVLGFASVPAWAGETDSTTFRIQDYIPERYVDFEWRVDGTSSFHDSSTITDPDPAARNNPQFQSYDRVNEDEGLSIVNRWRFRRETRQSRLLVALAVTTGYQRSNPNAYDSAVSRQGNTTITDIDRSASAASIAVTLSGRPRRYLLSDLFVEAEGVFQYWYTDKDDHSKYNYTYRDRVDSAGWFETRADERDETSHSITRQIDFVGEARVGWGRIYVGKYAATAANIIDQLKSSGLLLRKPSKAEMVELTKTVHYYRDRFNADEREHRAAAITELLADLIALGLLADDNALSVLTVEDVLDYSSVDPRLFGWDIQAGFGGHDRYYSGQSNWEARRWLTDTRWNPDSSYLIDTVSSEYSFRKGFSRSRSFSPADHYIVRAEYCRPLNSRWQFNVAGTYLSYFKRNTEPEVPAPRVGDYYYVRTIGRDVYSLESVVEYHYDLRTTLALAGCFVDTSRTNIYRQSCYFCPSCENVEWKEDRHNYRVRLSATYRLSRTTTVFGDWYHLWQFARTDQGVAIEEKRSEATFFSAGITHWLF